VAYPPQEPRFKECSFGAPISNEKELVVRFPPVEINGSRHDLDPMRFSLQKAPAVCWLSA
jgi:hypothetical protein